MRPATVAMLRSAGLDPDTVGAVVATALAEDLADGPDVTTQATVPAGAHVDAAFVSREDGVLAGGPVALAVIDAVADRLGAESYALASMVGDGTAIRAGEAAIVLRGPAAVVLSAERTALNLLTHLSGVATTTSKWVQAVAGTRAQIRDTRKTLPGLRALEKYAVRCGGGVNHRMSLSDAALIKDNHIVAAGSVPAAIAAVRALRPDLSLEVEVDTLGQFDEAMDAGATLVLLDNFSLADTAEAVHRSALRAAAGGQPIRLESSGGLTLERARDVAATGVDYLSIGALTHSAPSLDIGLDCQLG